MKILCCGCSFTYGDELEDRKQAWPHKLGQMLEADVVNLGKQAASNRQILNQVIQGVEEHKPNFVFVQWSLPYRTEHHDGCQEYVVWPTRQWRGDYRGEWVEHTKIVTANYNENMRQWFAIQYFNITKLLDRFLISENLSFIQVDFDNHDPIIEILNKKRHQKNYLRPSQYVSLENNQENICSWYAPYPKAPKQHPLEEGHKAIARKFYEHYRNICGLS